MIHIKMTFYGALKHLNEESSDFLISSLKPINCLELKEKIIAQCKIKLPDFRQIDLIHDSALANSKTIFLPEELISESCSLLLLPPVCGG